MPEWMAEWPVGLRPSVVYAKVGGVELLLEAGDGRWALVMCRHFSDVPAPRNVHAQTVGIADTMADRSSLVARAYLTALRRTGAPAAQWLERVTQAAAQVLARRGSGAGEASATELVALLEGRLREPAALVSVADRAGSPEVAAAVLHHLIAADALSAALGVWEEFGGAIAEASQPATQACAAMMLALTGDRTSAVAHAEAHAAMACDSTTYQAAGSMMLLLRRYSESAKLLGSRARLDGRVGPSEQAMAAAALALDADGVVEAAARARAAGSENIDEHAAAMVRAGAYDAAETTLRERLGEEPEDTGHMAAVASLLLRVGKTREAAEVAARALASDPELVEALVVAGGAAVRNEAHAEGLRHLDRALAIESTNQAALLWRAQAMLLSNAAGDVNANLFAAPFDDTALWQLLFALVRAQRDQETALHGPLAYFHRALLRDSNAPDVYEPAFESDEGRLDLLWKTVARFEGCRVAPFSMRDEHGMLAPADELASTQAQATRWQHRLLDTPVDEVLAGFDALEERYPDSPHPQTYTAEIELWLGNYERAYALTDDMWQRTGTRWAYIGSGAALGFLGRFDEALERWSLGERTFCGFLDQEATHCFRGEVYRLMGRSAEARADLERATQGSSTRVGAWINLALVCLEEGDDAGGEGALEQVETQAPVLVWEASRGALSRPSVLIERGDAKAVLEEALRLMRGNRSSVVHSFVDHRGQFRVVPDRERTLWQRWAQNLGRLPGYGLAAWLHARALEG